MGKWLSQDLIGYPDGWNNFAYCCNRVTISYDYLGAAAGDIYSSAMDAALAWGREFNAISISSNKEYGSSIYEVNNGYTYTQPNIGDSFGVECSLPPEGSIVNAYIHSHGKYNDPSDNDFSSIDYNVANSEKIDLYLATPSGTLLKYIQKLRKKVIISSSLPSDPNHPKKE